jgi:uncharacterized phage protein gp47/JayE
VAFEIPSREELHTDFIADYAVQLPDRDVSRGSDPWRLSRVITAVVWSILARLLFFIKMMLPDTAKAEYLARWTALYQFPQKAAAGSLGLHVLQVTGTAGAAVPLDSQLSHADGTLYRISEAAVIGGLNSVLASVAAVSLGRQTNKVAGELLTFTVPPPDVDAQATLVGDLTDGVDTEDEEVYRERFLAHLSDPPEGGAVSDYVEWARSVPGVLSAYVYRNRRGLGTIDVAVLGAGSGAERVIADLSRVAALIEAKRPANVADYLVLTTVPQPQDITIRIGIDETTYGWDWDDQGLDTGWIITAEDAVGKTITVPAAPAAVTVGVRLTVGGEEATVTARVTDTLTLALTPKDEGGDPPAWFSSPAALQYIRASGDLVVPVQRAIRAVFAKLGPARSSYAAMAWDSSLRTAKIIAAATDLDGVDDAELAVPAANIAPADTYGATISFLTPGQIRVWKLVE